MNEETRKKISKSMKDKKHTLEARKNMSKAKQGNQANHSGHRQPSCPAGTQSETDASCRSFAAPARDIRSSSR